MTDTEDDGEVLHPWPVVAVVGGHPAPGAPPGGEEGGGGGGGGRGGGGGGGGGGHGPESHAGGDEVVAVHPQHTYTAQHHSEQHWRQTEIVD